MEILQKKVKKIEAKFFTQQPPIFHGEFERKR